MVVAISTWYLVPGTTVPGSRLVDAKTIRPTDVFRDKSILPVVPYYRTSGTVVEMIIISVTLFCLSIRKPRGLPESDYHILHTVIPTSS